MSTRDIRGLMADGAVFTVTMMNTRGLNERTVNRIAEQLPVDMMSAAAQEVAEAEVKVTAEEIFMALNWRQDRAALIAVIRLMLDLGLITWTEVDDDEDQ